MQQRALWAAMLSTGLLMACGGGGGGTEEPASTAAQVSVNGVAAKGLMAGAVVTVHAVGADGAVGDALVTTPAEVITDAAGQYSLSFAGTKDQPYVVRVTARAGTTHVDEVTSAEAGVPTSRPLPVGFAMRTLVVPATTGQVSTTASVTPFSEMAVAAAERVSGGITAANAAQAVSTVGQLLGFNPTTVLPAANGSSPEQQKLALMLTAVSKLADTGALGCATGDDGQKTQCVVDALASASSATSIKLSVSDGGGSTTDVSAALGTALSEVLADDALRGSVEASLLGPIVEGLKCAGDECIAAPAPGTTSAAAAIAAAKTLFTNVKADWSSLFSRGGASSIATGAANAELWKFREAMSGVQVPAEVMVKDASTLLMGIDLYNDYLAGREPVPQRGRGEGVTANDGSPGVADFNASSCGLYQDSATTLLATAPANANFIGCRSLFYVQREVIGDTTITTEWRHGFTVTPTGNGNFDYGTRARRRVNTCTGGSCTVENIALQASGYSGTVATTTTAGSITGFTIEGALAGAFTSGSTTLENERHTWSLSGTRSIDAQHMSTTNFSGSLVAYDSTGAVQGTLAVVSGETSETPVWRDASNNEVKPGSATAVSPFGGTLSDVALTLKWTTAGAEFEGTFAATDSVWDASGTNLAPTQATLAGALRNISGDVKQEFLSGKLEAAMTGYAGYDAQQPDSATNSYTVTMAFEGKVTAPGRPVLELTMDTSMKSHEDRPAAASLQYRSLVDGTPRSVISLAATRGIDGALNVSLTEATSDLSLTWSEGAASGLLKWGTTTIGKVSKGAQGVTFSDGQFMSLDVGI